MNGGARCLELPPRPEWAVFSDFDESWFAHSRTQENVSHLRSLEEFAVRMTRERHVLFAWVSGCTLDLIMEKCERHGIGLFPNYIAASHGGELSVSKGNTLEPETDWLNRIERESFSAEVEGIVAGFNRRSESLKPQVQFSKNIRSYYLGIENKRFLPRLREQAAAMGLNVSVSPSNPLAGDPSDTFDIDFTPGMCSKADVVAYILEKHRLTPDRAFAYGDNVGDLDMLRLVGHGRLLGNANPAAKYQGVRHLQLPYAQGILADLEENLK